jgi:hypothetical protein
MDKKSSSIRNMYQLILNILVLFDTIWSPVASVSAAVTSYRNKVKLIDDTAEEQQNSIKLYSPNKRKKKRTMADKALVTRGKLSAFAAVTGDAILLEKMKISFSKLFHMKDTACIGNAEMIYNAALELTPAQRTAADISSVEMDDLRSAIDNFKNVPSPIEMRAARKQLTETLSQMFTEGNAFLTDVLDGLMEQFKESNPDFYVRYFNARRTFETHRHTTLQGFTIDETTGEDLSDVQVIITSDEETFEESTDVQGTFKQQISPETNYKVKFVLPQYEDQEFENVKLNRGQHETLNVKLKKKDQ